MGMSRSRATRSNSGGAFGFFKRSKKPQITPRKRYKLARRAKNKLKRGEQRILPIAPPKRSVLSLPFGLPFDPKKQLPIKY